MVRLLVIAVVFTITLTCTGARYTIPNQRHPSVNTPPPPLVKPSSTSGQSCPKVTQTAPPPTEKFVCNCNYNVGQVCPSGPPPEPIPKAVLSEKLPPEECKWQLVFKAVKGSGRNVFTDFTDGSVINENSAEAMVISDSSLPYKSPLLSDWDRLFIKQVRVDVFNKGERKTWLVFDGTTTTRTSWFSQERLIASPYNDLKTGTFAYFSAEGKPSVNTRFLINERDGSCAEDCGYLMVVDQGTTSTCPWASIEPRPYFLYSPNPEMCCRWTIRPTCPGLIADVMFVIDTSGSIDDSEFTELLVFLQNIVTSWNTSSELVRVGAISFSTDVQMEFKLNEYFTQTGIISAINQILNTFGGTNTAAALNFLKSTAFLGVNGNRPEAPDVVIFLTDGQSTDPVATLQAASNIETEQYLVFTVGIGTSLNQDELNAISTDPSFSLRVDDFSQLNSILDTLLNSACSAVNPNASRNPAQETTLDEKIADVFAISVQTCPME